MCYVLEKAVEMVKREYARNRMCVILNLNLGIFSGDTGENTCQKERREQNEQPEGMVGK